MPVGSFIRKAPVQKSNDSSGNDSKNQNQNPKETKASVQDIIDNVKDKSDEDKYKIATMVAQNNLADQPDVNDRKLKEEIDNIYSQMDTEKSGREMRGENVFTDVIGGMKGFIDDATLGTANLIDTGVNAFGDLIGNIDEGTGKSIRDAFTGSDLQGFVDAGADIALSALGPIGIGLMIGKNAIQQSDNLADALGGRDHVTLDSLDASQIAGRGLESVLGVGLSAVPGIGKINNLAKFGKAISPVAETAKDAGKVTKALNGLKDFKNNIDAANKALPTVSLKNRDVVKNLAKQSTPFTKEGQAIGKEGRKIVRNELRNMTPGNRDIALANRTTMNKNIKKVSEALQKNSDKNISDLDKMNKAVKSDGFLKSLGKGVGTAVASSAAGLGGLALAELADGNNLTGRIRDKATEEGVTGNATQVLAGAPAAIMGLLARKQVGPTGTRNALIPALAMAANSAMKQQGRLGEEAVKSKEDNDRILEALKLRK